MFFVLRHGQIENFCTTDNKSKNLRMIAENQNTIIRKMLGPPKINYVIIK